MSAALAAGQPAPPVEVDEDQPRPQKSQAAFRTISEVADELHIPQHVLSRVSSYDWFGSLALDPIGLAIWGPIAGWIGIQASLWTACGLIVTSALALLAVPELRRLPAFPPPDETSAELVR